MNACTILAIDPAPTHSGIVLCHWNGVSDVPAIIEADPKRANNSVLELIRQEEKATVVIEMPRSHGAGQPASQALINTAIWAGQFIERSYGDYSETIRPLGRTFTRDEVLSHFGIKKGRGMPGADSQIRTYLIQRYSMAEGIDPKLVKFGPLKEVTADAWQALAVAVCWLDLHRRQARESA